MTHYSNGKVTIHKAFFPNALQLLSDLFKTFLFKFLIMVYVYYCLFIFHTFQEKSLQTRCLAAASYVDVTSNVYLERPFAIDPWHFMVFVALENLVLHKDTVPLHKYRSSRQKRTSL